MATDHSPAIAGAHDRFATNVIVGSAARRTSPLSPKQPTRAGNGDYALSSVAGRKLVLFRGGLGERLLERAFAAGLARDR